jgi:DNA-binding transcriptional ArsR family regulator
MAETGLDRKTAEAYAQAYRCLADPTRILVLNRLAQARRPMTVRDLVRLVDVGQSTVSHHLRILLEAGFVRVTYTGNSSLFQVNDECLHRFPGTAAAILSQASVGAVDCASCESPGVIPAGELSASLLRSEV